jgi:vancomycin aglycone glucosyltransferase
MRVLLSTIGSRGDVQPLAALAMELRAHGHDVRLCVPPDFREWIEGMGFAVTPIGPELRKMTASLPPPGAPPLDPERRRQLAEFTVASQFETVAAAARGCEVIIAATALQIAARSVAEQQGIRYLFAGYCPAVFPSPHHAPPPLPPLPGQAPVAAGDNRELWAADAARFNQLFAPALNARRTALGLLPVDDVRAHVFGDQAWLAADATLAPWPDPADDSVFQTGAWILPDDRPLPADLQAFLDAGDPPIYFGFGSMRAAPDLGGTMLEAARTLGQRAIVSRGWADLSLPDGQRDCLGIGEVNQQALFRRVAAVVHHGGAGTTTAAALAGAPQVIAPQLYDQHYWAGRIHDLAIGTAHAPGAPTVASLKSALELTLQQDVAARAKSVAARVRRDGARLAAERVSLSAPQP